MKKISANEITENPFELGDKWALLTAEMPDGSINSMTIGWGGFGIMWAKKTTTIVVRPQRFTRKFIDASQTYTLSFFDEEHKDALKLLGSKSGENSNKMEESGLEFIKCENGVICKEAECNIVCKILYKQEFKEECFIDENLATKWYPENDYHYMYIGEILEAYTK